MRLKSARLVCLALIAGEFLEGLFIYLVHKFNLVQLKPDLSYLKPLYYTGAGVVVVLFVVKKILLNPSRFLLKRDEKILPLLSSSFVILTALASSLSLLGVALYFLTASLKYSLIMVLIAIIASLMVYPFPMVVEGIIYEVKRRREMGPPPSRGD